MLKIEGNLGKFGGIHYLLYLCSGKENLDHNFFNFYAFTGGLGKSPVFFIPRDIKEEGTVYSKKL